MLRGVGGQFPADCPPGVGIWLGVSHVPSQRGGECRASQFPADYFRDRSAILMAKLQIRVQCFDRVLNSNTMAITLTDLDLLSRKLR